MAQGTHLLSCPLGDCGTVGRWWEVVHQSSYCPCGSAVKYLVVSLGLLLFNRACGMGEGQDMCRRRVKRSWKPLGKLCLFVPAKHKPLDSYGYHCTSVTQILHKFLFRLTLTQNQTQKGILGSQVPSITKLTTEQSSVNSFLVYAMNSY